MAKYLLSEYSDVGVEFPRYSSPLGEVPVEVLEEMIHNGIARARRYQVTWESTLTSFVSIMFVVAPNFDEHPLIRRVLNDNNISPDLRVDMLFERTEEENWDEAEAQYDPQTWGVNPEPPPEDEG
jgi:hypothetical protein